MDRVGILGLGAAAASFASLSFRLLNPATAFWPSFWAWVVFLGIGLFLFLTCRCDDERRRGRNEP